jgi:nucleotide-binding universal stress UspA family protein
MMKIGKILFPTDFSDCAEQAFSFALLFARKYQAEIHLLHCVALDKDKPYGSIVNNLPDIEEIFSELKDDVDQKMTEEINTHETKGLSIIKVKVQDNHSSDAILKYSKKNDIDLIIMGTHGRRGIGYAFLGSSASEAVRMADCPVLTIREKRENKPFVGEEHILVPVDFSEHSIIALRHACEIAMKNNSRLDIIHVVEEATYPKVYGIAENITNVIKEKSHKELQKICEEIVGSKVKYYTYAVAGNSPYQILNFAEKNKSGLIVISTHGLTGLKHFLLGSVAELVVRRAPCPVLTVKAFGKSLL